MSHDPAWAQSDVVSRIPYRRRSFWSLVLLSLRYHTKKRRSALGQWEERALCKRKKKWRRRSDREEWVEKKKNQERVVMGQYRSCGLHEVFHFTKSPLSLSLRNRKQHFLVSSFHHSHSTQTKFEWWKQGEEIKPNTQFLVGPTQFLVWVMRTESYDSK